MDDQNKPEHRPIALTPINPGPTPNDWKIKTIGEVSHKVTNGFVGSSLPHQVEEGVTYLQGFNVRPSKIELKNRTFVSREFHKSNNKSQLKAGDVLVVQSGHIGTAARVPEDFGEANCHALIIVDLHRDKVVPDYLVEHLNSPIGRARMRGLHVGSSILHINTSELAKYRLPLPPLDEQRKIAEILRTWDKAIEKLEALRAAKRDQLTGVTQKLLGIGGAFPDRWKLYPLSAISIRVRHQNDGGNHPVMTISAKSGFRLQSDKFSRDMAGSSVERYILLHEGEFAYNKGNSLTAPYGCIFPLDRPTALVPFVYFCFALKPSMNREFFAHLFAAGALNHQLSRLINSGVRNDGLLNLNPEDFFGCKVPVPPTEEQLAIASVLSAAKQEIVLLETEIEALICQKRGLMQMLLTGQWRVTIESDEEVAS
ncbi:MAG: restriction endonuclease subunit S [Rhodocyclaceae bacterium]|nr:restriction endonuclease subunit S [Rhodocyclaceae bacterium]